MYSKEDIRELAKEFEGCQKVLVALGDENRQHLIIEMMQMGNCDGLKVGEITKCSHLSRPAVSHHLQILKDAGILKVRKEATRNYYYFNPEMEGFKKLIHVLERSVEIASGIPERSED